MWTQFLLENGHFALNLFTALILFAIAWLYFDAWLTRKKWGIGIRIIGFFLLSLSYLVHALTVDSSVFAFSFFSKDFLPVIVAALRIPGYILILLSLLADPLQPRPDKKQFFSAAIFGGNLSLISFISFFYPFLACCTGFMYVRRATVGLENHMKSMALGFYILSISELLALAGVFSNTNNINIANIVAPFGVFWIAEHLCLLISIIILGKGVFKYLFLRMQTQIFMIFTAFILVIFSFTTVTFTALLLKNMEQDSLKQLETNVKVLDLALQSKKTEITSDAQIVAQDPQIISSIKDKSRQTLDTLSQNFLLIKKQSSLVITDKDGKILARGEDKDRVGDSLSSDLIFKRVISTGEETASIVSKDAVSAPEVSIKVGAPIKDGEDIIGVVILGSVIDNAFLDGIKQTSGLDTSVYGGNQLAATTILSSNDGMRMVGVKEEDKLIKDSVLGKNKEYLGSLSLLNVPYYGAYLPLTDMDNVPAGMLFVGKPQVAVLRAAGESIELTFLVSIVLLVIAIIPAYLLSRFLAKQL